MKNIALFQFLSMMSESDVYSVEQQLMVKQNFLEFLDKAVACANQGTDFTGPDGDLLFRFITRLTKEIRNEPSCLSADIFGKIEQKSGGTYSASYNAITTPRGIVGEYLTKDFSTKQSEVLYHLLVRLADPAEEELEVCHDPIFPNKSADGLVTYHDPNG